jgi:hypothetical protein
MKFKVHNPKPKRKTKKHGVKKNILKSALPTTLKYHSNKTNINNLTFYLVLMME